MLQRVPLLLCVFNLLFQDCLALTGEDVSIQINQLLTIVSTSSYSSISQIDSWIEELNDVVNNSTAETKADIETTIQYINEQINSTVTQALSGGFDLSNCTNTIEDGIQTLRKAQYSTISCINSAYGTAKVRVLSLTSYFQSRIGQAQSLQRKVEPCGTEQNCLLELQSNVTKLRVTLPLLNQLDVGVFLGNVNSTSSNVNDVTECSRNTSISIDTQSRDIIKDFITCANLLVNAVLA